MAEIRDLSHFLTANFPFFQVGTKVEEVLKEDKLDAIVCVAGGWAGGNAASAGTYML